MTEIIIGLYSGPRGDQSEAVKLLNPKSVGVTDPDSPKPIPGLPVISTGSLAGIVCASRLRSCDGLIGVMMVSSLLLGAPHAIFARG